MLDRLASHFPDDARFCTERSVILLTQNSPEEARVELEKSLELEPTQIVARSLTVLLLAGAQKATNWTVLKPTEMKSERGATLTLLKDGSILAGGEDLPGESYRLVMNSDLKSITAYRLEVLTDAGLPSQGPGRGPHGNFGISWGVQATNIPGKNDSQPLRIRSAIADYSYAKYPINKSHWNIEGGQGLPHTAFLALAAPMQNEAGNSFTLTIKGPSGVQHGDQNLGRFRLSVTDDPTAFDREEVHLRALQLTDPWIKLAAAYHVVGDQPALDKLLEQHPAARGVVGELNSLSWQETLDASDVAIKSANQFADGTWDVNLEGATITDLTILKRMPISRLNLKKTAVSDLTPLRGMALKSLNLEGTKVTDLVPLQDLPLEELNLNTLSTISDLILRGMPLTNVRLIGCRHLTDLSPLSEAIGLTLLALPPNAKEIEFLRTFPKLERLSFSQAQPQTHLPAQTAAGFWKDYDAGRK